MVVLNTVRKPQEEIILLPLLTLSFALKTSLLHKICSNHGREYFLPLWKGNLGHNTKTYRKKILSLVRARKIQPQNNPCLCHVSVGQNRPAHWRYLFTEAFFLPFDSHNLISNSLYCLTYNSFDVNLENLVLDQLIIPWLIFYFIIITCLLDIVRRNSLLVTHRR